MDTKKRTANDLIWMYFVQLTQVNATISREMSLINEVQIILLKSANVLYAARISAWNGKRESLGARALESCTDANNNKILRLPMHQHRNGYLETFQILFYSHQIIRIQVLFISEKV